MGDRFRTFALLCLALALAGCNTDTLDYGATVRVAQLQAEAIVPVRPRPGPYVLGLNDSVRVKAYNEPEISGEYIVDSTGFVSIPLAGRVRAAGLTPEQLQRAIMSRLNNGIIHDPRVTVEVSTYTPFYIQGEVKRAGEFSYRPGLMVQDAVAEAGGFTYRANDSKVFIRPKGLHVEEVYPLDVPIPIHPGDNIRIPERWF
jgi:protein involved in polysaccharide export with SLBB domain